MRFELIYLLTLTISIFNKEGRAIIHKAYTAAMAVYAAAGQVYKFTGAASRVGAWRSTKESDCAGLVNSTPNSAVDGAE